MKHYEATARKTDQSLQVDVHSRGIHQTIDEPKNAGGTNTGMNPVELELSALGAALQETAERLAGQQGFKYDQLTINLEGDLDARGFMGDPDIRNGFQEIRVDYRFKTAEVAADCKQFVQEVEKQCWLYNTLVNGTKVIVDDVVKN
ncbi:MAG TPA: OsmC family protein [Candidatus Limosilactobacillus intestinigallinarum]|jgi:uncharacterized OsmC-like protein|nr:OsmC family protein [Candidatus Limosilactobacillus intestinigallinarum]